MKQAGEAITIKSTDIIVIIDAISTANWGWGRRRRRKCFTLFNFQLERCRRVKFILKAQNSFVYRWVVKFLKWRNNKSVIWIKFLISLYCCRFANQTTMLSAYSAEWRAEQLFSFLRKNFLRVWSIARLFCFSLQKAHRSSVIVTELAIKKIGFVTKQFQIILIVLQSYRKKAPWKYAKNTRKFFMNSYFHPSVSPFSVLITSRVDDVSGQHIDILSDTDEVWKKKERWINNELAVLVVRLILGLIEEVCVKEDFPVGNFAPGEVSIIFNSSQSRRAEIILKMSCLNVTAISKHRRY